MRSSGFTRGAADPGAASSDERDFPRKPHSGSSVVFLGATHGALSLPAGDRDSVPKTTLGRKHHARRSSGATGGPRASGITVIDLSHVYNGPYATLLMALAGARVIKESSRSTDARGRRASSFVAAIPGEG